MFYFLKGMGSIINGMIVIVTFGQVNPYQKLESHRHQPSIQELQQQDAQKIAEDWQKVGDDMRKFWH